MKSASLTQRRLEGGESSRFRGVAVCCLLRSSLVMFQASICVCVQNIHVLQYQPSSKGMLEPVTASTSQEDRVKGREDRVQDPLSCILLLALRIELEE